MAVVIVVVLVIVAGVAVGVALSARNKKQSGHDESTSTKPAVTETTETTETVESAESTETTETVESAESTESVESAESAEDEEEPEIVLLGLGVSVTTPSIDAVIVVDEVEASSTSEVAAASVETPEVDEISVIIELDVPTEDASVLVLTDGPLPLDHVETKDNDEVLKALIGRVRITRDDVTAVASQLERRDDLDAEGVATVLADLAEIAAEAERVDELTLFSQEVPRRPGQLTRFAELDDTERRRVIIRVLCLLVARSVDGTDDDLSVEDAPARNGWPGDDSTDADDLDLPNRVRLVKS